MIDIDLWHKPQLDVVAVEFYNRARAFAPIHRFAVTFRDGAMELVDVPAYSHCCTADLFSIAARKAIEQRRTNLLLEEQRQRLRDEFLAEFGMRA